MGTGGTRLRVVPFRTAQGAPDSLPIRAASAARGLASTSCGCATPIASYRCHPSVLRFAERRGVRSLQRNYGIYLHQEKCNMRRLTTGVLCVLWCVSVDGGGAARIAPVVALGNDRPHGIARLPDPAYTCLQASSHDRRQTDPQDAKTWHANDDHDQFIRIETNQGRKEWVLMEHQGRGRWCASGRRCWITTTKPSSVSTSTAKASRPSPRTSTNC